MVGTNGAPKERENAAWQAIVAVVVVAASERERQRETETEKEFPSLLSFFPSKSLECFFCCWVAALVVVVDAL
jgi:hypothetical protein